MSTRRAPPTASTPAPLTPHGDTGEHERLLLALADHLHEHCECVPGASGTARCDACDLRAQLRQAREDLLAWRAEGRRILQRRDDALANGTRHVSHGHRGCDECVGLTALARALGDYARPPTTSS